MANQTAKMSVSRKLWVAETTTATLVGKIQELQTKLSAIEAVAEGQLTYIHAHQKCTGEAVVSAGGVKIAFARIKLSAADTPTTKRLGTAGVAEKDAEIHRLRLKLAGIDRHGVPSRNETLGDLPRYE